MAKKSSANIAEVDFVIQGGGVAGLGLLTLARRDKLTISEVDKLIRAELPNDGSRHDLIHLENHDRAIQFLKTNAARLKIEIGE